MPYSIEGGNSNSLVIIAEEFFSGTVTLGEQRFEAFVPFTVGTTVERK